VLRSQAGLTGTGNGRVTGEQVHATDPPICSTDLRSGQQRSRGVPGSAGFVDVADELTTSVESYGYDQGGHGSYCMSLDGFVAQPDDNPAELFDWYWSGDVVVPSAQESMTGTQTIRAAAQSVVSAT
jgi:hypothetical protein